MKPSPFALALGGLMAMAAALGIGRFVYTPILPHMAEALSLDKSQAGLIASANFVGYLAGALLAGLRLPGSRRSWLLGALAANAAGLAAMAATTGLAGFMALRMIAGAASAFALIFSSALVLDRLAQVGRSGLSAVHFAGVGTGIAASALLVAGLLRAGLPWSGLWIASGLLAALLGVLAAALVPAEEGLAASQQSARPSPLSGAFLALLAGYGLFGFGYIITATFIVDMVRSTASLRPLEPFIWLLVGLSAVPSVAIWTEIARRCGIARAFAAACLVEGTGVALSVLWLHPVSALLAAIFVGGTFMGLTALGLIGARQSAVGDPRRRIALMTASFSVGQILGPAFAGFVYDATGSLTLPTLAAALALLLAAGLTLAVGPR